MTSDLLLKVKFDKFPSKRSDITLQVENINLISKPEMECLRTSLASSTSLRAHFEVLGLGLGLEGQVLGLKASSPQKLPCPRLEDSMIF